MGHERIGVLPRRESWKGIVADIAQAMSGSASDIARLASDTLNLVRHRYRSFSNDRGVQAAFGYLVALSTPDATPSDGLASVDVELEANPTALTLVARLASWVKEHEQSPEYSELASRAAADAIAIWSRERMRQGQLFATPVAARDIWPSGDARAFCTIARTFFAKITERYLSYFVERSASAQADSLRQRESLRQALRDHVAAVSQHAFETSVIVQSFAAGWFNKYARNSRPTDKQIAAFLHVAFGKMQEELAREAMAP